MNRIRPLIVSRTLPYLGGREVMVDEIIKYFSKTGTVWVLTPDKYKGSKKINVINRIHLNESLIKKLQKNRINIVNCHTFYLFDIASNIAKRLNIPLVFTLHGIFIDFYDKKYNSIIKKISGESSLVITVSETYLEKLKETLPLKTSKFIKIQNGIKPFISSQKSNSVSKIKYIVIPARLNNLKGLEYAAQAAKKLKEVKFCICHPTGRNNNIDEDAYKNELIKESDNLLNFKKLDHKDILLEMRKADLVLLPSLIEGISIAVLEAMSLGKIVAATKVGGNPEVIKDGINGFLFKPKSSDAIIKTINKILKINPNNKRIISQNAILTVRNKFDINVMLRKYKNTFNHLINNENK